MRLIRRFQLWLRLVPYVSKLSLWRFLMAGLSPEQLALIQADLDDAKAAAVARTSAEKATADATVVRDQSQAALDAASAAQGIAVSAEIDADKKLVSDVDAMFNPPTT